MDLFMDWIRSIVAKIDLLRMDDKWKMDKMDAHVVLLGLMVFLTMCIFFLVLQSFRTMLTVAERINKKASPLRAPRQEPIQQDLTPAQETKLDSPMEAEPTSEVSEESLFEDLCNEVRNADPSGKLTYSLICCLEKCNQDSLTALCSKTKEGCAPLFIACKQGNVKIAEYLITVCKVDKEQRGLFRDTANIVHDATPLWCAAVAGHIQVVEALLRLGANVDAVSGKGSTAVRSACFTNHVDIVKLLVKHSADIHRPNNKGGTCLINSVQSVELCEFLLRNGADVNAQDNLGKTALHYAIQLHNLDTTKLLLKHNADAHLQNNFGDDALQTACLMGAIEIFNSLVDNVAYDPERVASACELLGAVIFEEGKDAGNLAALDTGKAMHWWRTACDIRERFELNKAVLPPKQQFCFAEEFSNRTQLEALVAADPDALGMQSLFVCERVLGATHKDTIYRIMRRGSQYAAAGQHQRCLDLYKHGYQLRMKKVSEAASHDDSRTAYRGACYAATVLIKLYSDLQERGVLVWATDKTEEKRTTEVAQN